MIVMANIYLIVALITGPVFGFFMGGKTYDETMPLPFNVFAMLFFGTFFGVALGVTWPISVPLTLFLSSRENR